MNILFQSCSFEHPCVQSAQDACECESSREWSCVQTHCTVLNNNCGNLLLVCLWICCKSINLCLTKTLNFDLSCWEGEGNCLPGIALRVLTGHCRFSKSIMRLQWKRHLAPRHPFRQCFLHAAAPCFWFFVMYIVYNL